MTRARGTPAEEILIAGRSVVSSSFSMDIFLSSSNGDRSDVQDIPSIGSSEALLVGASD